MISHKKLTEIAREYYPYAHSSIIEAFVAGAETVLDRIYQIEEKLKEQENAKR